MRRRIALVLVFAAACSKPPTEAECRAMLDRYVDMTIDQDPELERAGELARPALRGAKVEARKAGAEYARSLERCPREVTRSALECAMKAPNPNQWEACLY